MRILMPILQALNLKRSNRVELAVHVSRLKVATVVQAGHLCMPGFEYSISSKTGDTNHDSLGLLQLQSPPGSERQ